MYGCVFPPFAPRLRSAFPPGEKSHAQQNDFVGTRSIGRGYQRMRELRQPLRQLASRFDARLEQATGAYGSPGLLRSVWWTGHGSGTRRRPSRRRGALLPITG